MKKKERRKEEGKICKANTSRSCASHNRKTPITPSSPREGEKEEEEEEEEE